MMHEMFVCTTSISPGSMGCALSKTGAATHLASVLLEDGVELDGATVNLFCIKGPRLLSYDEVYMHKHGGAWSIGHPANTHICVVGSMHVSSSIEDGCSTITTHQVGDSCMDCGKKMEINSNE